MKFFGAALLALLGCARGDKVADDIDPFVTTVFTAPPRCTEHAFTEVPADPGKIWYNVIDPGADDSYTSCYPEQFYRSVLDGDKGTLWSAFKQLVCPYDWDPYTINSTYVVCCPARYMLEGLNKTNSDRPAERALCISTVWPDVFFHLTSYDTAGSSSVFYYTAPKDGTYVKAMPFDGITVSPGPSTGGLATSEDPTSTTSSEASLTDSSTSTLGEVPTGSSTGSATGSATGGAKSSSSSAATHRNLPSTGWKVLAAVASYVVLLV